MTELKINTEYLKRHLFTVVVLLGMGGWFGYDGFVTYPAKDASTLYAESHNGEAAASVEVADKFKASAIPRQKQFMALCLIGALIVGVRLSRSAAFKFQYDEHGFICNKGAYKYSEITSVDRSLWEKKGILVLHTKDGKITLDGWHHKGVKEFEKAVNGKIA